MLAGNLLIIVLTFLEISGKKSFEKNKYKQIAANRKQGFKYRLFMFKSNNLST
jgi:hypothetical protein